MPSALFVTTVPITLEAFLLPFADHFRAEGWIVDAAANSATRQGALVDHFDRVFDVDWSRNPLAPSNLTRAARRMRTLVAQGEYDIVHVHTPVAAFVTRLALRRLHRSRVGPCVIYTAHGFHFYQGQRALPHFLYRTLERVATPWTDMLVTVNREDFEAAEALGYSAEQVRLIPGIGVDCAHYSSDAIPREDVAVVRAQLLGDYREAEDTEGEGFLLTMIAELAAVKRHALALEALRHVRSPRVHLALVGTGPLESRLRSTVARLGLERRVTFAGYRQDIPTVLAASDALLLTSEREGLNRSALEAMAAGKPVIGTETRGITAAVGVDAGWLVGHNDVAALARTIDAVAEDSGEVRRRGRLARERANTEFGLDRIVAAYDALFRDALARCPRTI
jgi:glycosyltransferase involved in cell wall biosynthesis